MGIEIRPKERDNHSDITRLSVKYGNNNLETPNRLVTVNDLNAKSRIGADIPLTRLRKCFIHEVNINAKVVESILTRNGYLAEFKLRIESTINRIQRANPLKIVFPKITKKGGEKMLDSTRTQSEVIHFLFQLMDEMNDSVDLFMFQFDKLTQQQLEFLDHQDMPYVPVMDIHNEKQIRSYLPNFINSSSSINPFLAFTYASYVNANRAYSYVISKLDLIHESNKGIITVEAPRTLEKDLFDKEVSAPHYSSFLISDLVGEKLEMGFHKVEENPEGDLGVSQRIHRFPPKIFEKNDLTVQTVTAGTDISQRHSGEDLYFNSDTALNELFWRTVKGVNTDADYERNRVSPMSRIHESLMTNLEYKEMRISIKNQELTNYRNTKHRLNDLLLNQGL